MCIHAITSVACMLQCMCIHATAPALPKGDFQCLFVATIDRNDPGIL